MSLLVMQSGKGTILDRMKAIVSRTKNLTPLSEPVKRVLFDANKERALRGVDFTGQPYEPLKPSTLKDRAQKGFPAGPPLVRNGVYARVIQGCRIDVQIDANRVRFLKSWPEVKWMDRHIEGTPRMARRDPAGWGQEELAEVRRMLPGYILGR